MCLLFKFNLTFPLIERVHFKGSLPRSVILNRALKSDEIRTSNSSSLFWFTALIWRDIPKSILPLTKWFGNKIRNFLCGKNNNSTSEIVFVYFFIFKLFDRRNCNCASEWLKEIRDIWLEKYNQITFVEVDNYRFTTYIVFLVNLDLWLASYFICLDFCKAKRIIQSHSDKWRSRFTTLYSSVTYTSPTYFI